jgi:ATP-binding cassette subfamily F protein 3
VGKSTFLKILTTEYTAQAGKFEFGRRLSIGYYAQDRTALDPKRSILEEIRAARPEFSEQQARTYAARFQFQRDDVFKPIGALSGGEQSRVRLATLIISQPDILILDEPTNHLDIPSREALEEALEEYTGTVIAVSHDRYFLDRTTSRLLVMRRECCKMYEGNYSFYLEQVEQVHVAEMAVAAPKKPTTGKKAKATASAKKTSPYDHLSVQQLEEMLIERETRLSILQERFGEPAVCKDPELLAELQEEADGLAAEISEIDAAWQERAETHG